MSDEQKTFDEAARAYEEWKQKSELLTALLARGEKEQFEAALQAYEQWLEKMLAGALPPQMGHEQGNQSITLTPEEIDLLKALFARDYIQSFLEKEASRFHPVDDDLVKRVNKSDEKLKNLWKEKNRKIASANLAAIRRSRTVPLRRDSRWWWYQPPRSRPHWLRDNIVFLLILIVLLALALRFTITAIPRMELIYDTLKATASTVISVLSLAGQLLIGGGVLVLARHAFGFLQRQLEKHLEEVPRYFTLGVALLSLAVLLSFFSWIARPITAWIYDLGGRYFVTQADADQAWVYLGSATALDPLLYARDFALVGCLYLTPPDRAPEAARSNFQRVLEADPRLVLAQIHLANLYIEDDEIDNYNEQLLNAQALLLAADLTQDPSLQNTTQFNVDTLAYLLSLYRGHVYLELGEYQRAKADLEASWNLYTSNLSARVGNEAPNPNIVPCSVPNQEDDRQFKAYLASTPLNLRYWQARTLDALICTGEGILSDAEAAEEAWMFVSRWPQGDNTTQDEVDIIQEAKNRLRMGGQCVELASGEDSEVLGDVFMSVSAVLQLLSNRVSN